MRMDRLKEGERMIMYSILSANIKKGKRLPAPHKIWPLLTDQIKEFKPVLPTREELEAINKRYFGNGNKPGVKRTT